MSTEHPLSTELRSPGAAFARRVSSVEQPSKSSRWWTLIALLACVGFMLPTLFYPFGPDGAMFAAGARRLLHGAVYYRDLIDVKPPLIYYAYALVQSLFGSSPLAVRAIDGLVQLGVALGLYALAERRGGRRWGMVAAVLYCLLYAALGYQSTAQTESIGAALGLAAFAITLRGHRSAGGFAAGVLVGVAALVKTTLLAMLPAIVITELLRSREERGVLARNIVAECAGTAAILALFVMVVLGSGLGHDFALQQQFTRAFVALHLLNPAEMLETVTTDLASGLAFTLSLPVMLAAALSVRQAAVKSRSGLRDRQADLLRYASVWILMLLLSIIVESRYHAYHFIRIMPFAALLAAAVFRKRESRGGDHGETDLSEQSGQRSAFRIFLAIVLCALALVTMPIARWAWYALPSWWAVTGQGQRYEEYYSRGIGGYAFREHREIAAMVRQHHLRDGELFVASGVASYIYNAVGVSPAIPFLHSTFYTAPWAPAEWRDLIARVFRTSPPKIIVLGHDAHNDLNGSNVPSDEGLRRIPGIDAKIRDRYHPIGRTASFSVYELTR